MLTRSTSRLTADSSRSIRTGRVGRLSFRGLALLCLLTAVLPSIARPQPPGEAATDETLRSAWFAMSRRVAPDVELGPAEARLDVMRFEIEDAVAAATGGKAKVAALVAYLFGEARFTSDPNLADPQHLYAHEVLATRRGYCLSLGVAVLAAIEGSKLPIHGVAAPRHFFLRWDDGSYRANIELTEKGRLRDDAFYRSMGISPEAEKAGIWLVPLDRRRIVAQLLNNESYVLLRAGRAAEARRSNVRALALDPRLPEGHVNAGVLAARAGDAAKAEASFARAARWFVGDRGVAHDRALAALVAGDVTGALARVQEARREHPKDATLRSLEDAVKAAMFEPRNWDPHQDRIDREGRRLAAAGKLSSGLRGAYFANPRLEGDPRTRIDRRIDFEWRWSAPLPRFPNDDFSVRWTGWLRIPQTAPWTVSTVANDGIRVWIDEVPVIDDWKRNEGSLQRATLPLRAGWHRVRIEYFEYRRFAGLTFDVRKAGAARSLPASALHHAVRDD